MRLVRASAPALALRSCIHHHQPPLQSLLLQLAPRQIRFQTKPSAAAEKTPPEALPVKLPPVDHVPGSEKELRNSRPPNLIRPIGLQNPPQPGENSGEDPRGWSQRRDDFVDYDKHIAKRQRLANEMYTPYFRDFSRMSKQFKGKSWMAPPLLFRSDKALFFPNLMGRTLNTSERLNTTHALYGNVSVVTVFSSAWAENQVKTFVDGLEDEVPALKEGKIQHVDINIEENWLKAAIIKMFLPRLQARLPFERHDQYFIVTKGVSRDVRHDMGLWNGRVGYVYIVDWNCRIRWAASGNAEPEEREALVKGLNKLAGDLKARRAGDAD